MSKLRPRILLLEPNQHVARRAKEHLVAAGYDTSWSKNAQDAINLADQHAPDLVIMELLLTAHSGIEFLYEFRSYSEWRAVPAIIFSRITRAELSVSDKVLADLGVVTVLYKPNTSLNRLEARAAAALAVRERA